MQYILTEEEYNTLAKKVREAPRISPEEFQTLCTKIADTMPVIWEGWGDNPPTQPWGCILSTKGEWYCDTCPVQDICRYPNKHWSK